MVNECHESTLVPTSRFSRSSLEGWRLGAEPPEDNDGDLNQNLESARTEHGVFMDQAAGAVLCFTADWVRLSSTMRTFGVSVCVID
jgi:hypothetical protein